MARKVFYFLLFLNFYKISFGEEKKQLNIAVLLFRSYIANDHIHAWVIDPENQENFLVNRWDDPRSTSKKYTILNDFANASKIKIITGDGDFNTLKNAWSEKYYKEEGSFFLNNCADSVMWLLENTGIITQEDKILSWNNFFNFSYAGFGIFSPTTSLFGATLPAGVYNLVPTESISSSSEYEQFFLQERINPLIGMLHQDI